MAAHRNHSFARIITCLLTQADDYNQRLFESQAGVWSPASLQPEKDPYRPPLGFKPKNKKKGLTLFVIL
jgi:hypothetical protein